MPAEAAKLLELAAAISDGEAVDWNEAEASASDALAAELVRELKLVAGVATVARSSGAPDIGLPAGNAPEAWGPLEIRGLLGSGSFGAVYRAWDPRLQRDVALKLLNRREVGPAAAASVVTEGRRLAQVRHPHVVIVHGADRFDGCVGIWMELIHGRTLENLIDKQGPLGAREAALVGIDLCGAVAAVHHAGLVHRDIKAQNIMRENGGRTVLMDFGAGEDAAGDAPEGTIGTPVYMAPELFLGGRASVRSDIYSLGVLLFRLVTGSYPVNGRTRAEIADAHARGDLRRLRDRRPDLPAEFVSAVERALATVPEERFASAGEMEAALSRVIAARGNTATTRRRWVALAAAAAVIALPLAAFAPPVRRTIAGWTAPPRVAVAVLPFTNSSGDAAQDHVARGVRDVLVGRLATIGALRVMAPSSPPSQGEKPPFGNAAFHIEGSAERVGDQLRVTARLLRAGGGDVLWADSLTRAFTDLLASQSEIAVIVARQVGVPLTEDERQRLARRYSTSAEAQDAYLQGRFLLYRFNRTAAADARAHFERSIQIDPEYALAHASLARLYLLQQEYRDLTPDQARPLALKAATRAAELGPELAEARVALAEVLFKVSHDMTRADAEYRGALELAPGSSLVRSPYARFLSAVGRPADALSQAFEGARLEPRSPEMMASVGITHIYRRDFAGAVDWYERAIALNPDYAPGYFGRGRARSFLGQFDAAVDDLKRAVTLSGHDPAYIAELGRVNAVAGWRNAAEEALGSLLRAARERPGSVAPQDLAYVYLALGDRDRACALLRDALAQHDTRILFLNVDPRVDALRGDTRFVEIIRALGL